MASMKELAAAQQFLVRDLTTYEDELFNFLYCDIGDFASSKSKEIVNQGRRISIYGVRGVGKSTAMQGILWSALTTFKNVRLLPVTVTVTGANSADSLRDLEDLFYRSVIAGVVQSSYFKRRQQRLKDGASRYAPWIARKITEASALLIPPLALASDLAEKSVKWLVSRVKRPDVETMLASKEFDAKQTAELLLNRMLDDGLVPVFAIDELDKVNDDAMLSDFFDGNQSWFQGKHIVTTLTYTFGESMRNALATSIRRFASVETYPGITSETDVEHILRVRAQVGVSQIERNEGSARRIAEEVFPSETIRAILNVSAPNTHLMLERAYQAIGNAIQSKASQVLPAHVIEEKAETQGPTELERLILRELRKGRLTPTDLSQKLDRKAPSIVRSLAKMRKDNWVIRVGAGKRAYYFLTPQGEAAIRRTDN